MNTLTLKLKKMAVIISVMALGLASCSKDNDRPDPDPNRPAMQDVALSGTVRNTSGAPLSGVRIISGEVSTTTGADGTFHIAQAVTVSNRAVVRFEKQGYFSLTRSGVKADEMHIEVVLQAKGNSGNSVSTTFGAAEAKTLSAGGMKVDIPASSLVRPDGSAYTGPVNADMLYLDPNNDNFTELMPGGDLAGLRANNSEAQLISYGMTEISLTDNAGNALQLKDNETSELTFPIPDGMENNPPATIPLWSFDDERGIWVEEGVATLQGDVYVGAVKHFSWHNLDVPADRVTIKGRATDCNGAPVSYVKITVEQTAAVTNSRGEYSVYVPANTPVTVVVKSRDYSDYSPEVSHNVAGKPGGSVVTQDISLPCRESGPGEDAIVNVSKGSITYLMDGATHILTFDNYGKRFRWDSEYGTGNHGVIVIDDLAKTYFMGADNMWYDLTYSSGLAETLCSVFLYRGDLYQQIPGVQTLPNETIAGKNCTVIRIPGEDGCDAKYAGWSGFVMLIEDCEGVAMVATEVHLEIPTNAFTKTMNIFD
jgi:hypothetical protein